MRALVLTLVAFALPAFPADSCPVTKAPAPAFVPPAPYNSSSLSGGFLLGSESLWTFVYTYDLDPSRPEGPPYAFKLIYWHPGLNWHHTDETNDLIVVARRFDAPSAPIVFTHRGKHGRAFQCRRAGRSRHDDRPRSSLRRLLGNCRRL